MKTTACLPALALLLSACGSPQGFLINDQRQTVAASKLAGISTSWTNDAPSVFRTSRTDTPTVSWIVNFIAVSEAQGAGGLKPCNSLTALRLEPRELKPFQFMRMLPNKSVEGYAPKEYNEAWFVDACGKIREWRVFDDPKDSRDPLTVLLWNANEIPGSGQ